MEKKYKIKYTVTETRFVTLKRKPTLAEEDLINHATPGTMFDIESDLIDWETEEVHEADHHKTEIIYEY